MIKGRWESRDTASKLAILALIVGLSFILVSLVISTIGQHFLKINILQENILDHLQNPTILFYLKLLQAASSLGAFIIPSIIFVYLASTTPIKFLYLKNKPDLRIIILACIVIVAGLPFIHLLLELNQMVQLPSYLSEIESWMRESEETAGQLTKAFLQMSGIRDYLLNVFVIALLPAIGEELIFRGLLQRLFTNLTKNAHWGIIISAAIFSAIHIQFYGFIPRFALGVLFGYFLLWSRSLWLPIVAHFANNFLAVTITFLFSQGLINYDIDKIGSEQNTGLLGFASALVCVGLIWVIWKFSRKDPIVI